MCVLHAPLSALEFTYACQEFLFYHQKESDAAEELVNPVTPWAQMMR